VYPDLSILGRRELGPFVADRRGPGPSCPLRSFPSVRIVRVLAKLEPGGAQLAALRVTRELGRLGTTARVLAGEATATGIALAAREGVEVETWGGRRGLQYATSEAFARWLEPRVVGAELVHAHMFGGWWAAARALGDAPATALVASEHNRLVWPGRPPGEELRSALGRVDRFFAHGPQARAAILEAGLAPERLAEGRSPVAGLDARPHPKLPVPRIVYSGRLHPEKGPDLLVEALARLSDPPVTLVLGDGPMASELRERVRALGLQRTVRLLGWVDDAAPYVAGAAVQAVPSREEAWSQSAVLAMGLGVPVVGADIPGLAHTLGEGRGRLVAARDPDALAEGLREILAGHHADPRPGLVYARRFAVHDVAGYYLRAYRQLSDHRQVPALTA